MATRVVVEFEDDEAAKAFVKNTLEDGRVYGDMISDFYEDGRRSYLAKVTAAYKKPTKFCEPDDGHRGRKRTTGWTRGRKWGWWVCGVCGKPTEKWARGDIWHYSMGYNLLPPSVSNLDRGQRSTLEWTEEELGLESCASSEDSS